MREQTSTYFDACQYACDRLDSRAFGVFPRIQALAKFNSLDELKSIIDGWAGGPPKAVPTGPWAPGATWGDSTRIEHQGGIFWSLRCQCGTVFKTSTNDTVPEDHRKCENCRLADELSEERQAVNARLETTAKKILDWHKEHDGVVWMKVHEAMRARHIESSSWSGQQFANDLHALCWVKIAAVADAYQDEGVKVSAWLGTVAKNVLLDFFKVDFRRNEIAPTGPIPPQGVPAPPTKPEEELPAKAARPVGSRPDNEDTRLSPWDKRQEWNG